jgi:hypothetical protein
MSRTPSRRPSLSATAVKAQLRSSTIACASDNSAMARRPACEERCAGQNVPILENSQYQNQMIKRVPPHAAT